MVNIFNCEGICTTIFIPIQHGQRVTGMDWAAKSNMLVTCAAVSFCSVCNAFRGGGCRV